MIQASSILTAHATKTDVIPVTDEVLVRSIADDRLHLILMPTEQCNLRCVYCYEDFELGLMPEAVIDGVVNLVKNRATTLRQLELGWFGGEPLMGMQVIRQISQRILEIQRSADFSISSSMSTNGVLLRPKLVTELNELMVQTFQISLDGEEEDHNATRKTVGNTGTFSTIWRNLQEMRRLPVNFNVLLRVHVHPGNVSSIQRLLIRIRDEFSLDGRFRVHLKAVERLSLSTELSTFSGEDARRILADLQSVLAGTPMDKDPRLSHPFCYASHANSLIVRSNGRVAKCTVAFSDSRNDIGMLRSDGGLELDASKWKPWVAGLLSRDSAAATCPLHHLPRFGGKKVIPVNSAIT